MPATSIEELPGVGPATAEKLRDAGYVDLMAIAVESPKVLAELAEIGENTAIKIIAAAKQAADVGGFETGDIILERRKNIRKLTSSSKAFDELMGGGLETQSIVEFYGEFGSGKTQLCFQLAVNATRPEEDGGLDGNVFIIDTENTFRPERIVQMALALDLDPDRVAEATAAGENVVYGDVTRRETLAAAGVLTIVPGAIVIWFVRHYIAKGFAMGRV